MGDAYFSPFRPGEHSEREPHSGSLKNIINSRSCGNTLFQMIFVTDLCKSQ